MMFHIQKRQVRWLSVTAKFLGILPERNHDVTYRKRKKIYKFYVGALTIGITVLFGISLYGRIVYVFPKMEKSSPILDGIYCISEYIINVLTLLTLNFVYCDQMDKYYSIVYSINKRFMNLNLYKDNDGSIAFAYVLFHVYFVFVVFYDFFFSLLPLGKYGFYFFTFEYFERYHIQITLLIVYKVLDTIRERFTWLNILLINITTCDHSISVHSVQATLELKPGSSKKFKKELRSKIEAATLIYSEICDLVDIFNLVFGLVVLSIIVNTIAITLTAINFIIVYVRYFNGDGKDMNFVGVMVAWVLLGSMSGVMLAKSSEDISQKMESVVVNTINLHTKLSIKALENEREESLYVKCSYLLLQNVINRRPVITAARFFDINYATVFILCTSFTSYLIVLLQFN